MKAILQVSDTGPLESIVVMLRSIGYDCYLPSESLRKELRSIGLDTVLEISGLVRGWGYERPFSLPEAGIADMTRSDVVYVDIKGHRAYDKVVKRWPNLMDRVLWYRIQGGRPEHVVNARGDHGNEIKPPCPVLTPNRYYAVEYETCERCEGEGWHGPNDGVNNWACPNCDGDGERKVPWYDTPRYVCWPPFYRFDEYYPQHGRKLINGTYDPPICLLHNASGWGYGPLIDNMRKLGVRIHGVGSPDGLVKHELIPGMLSRALCMVHLKSSDAPGYAIYESMAAACPIICTRRLIWRCRMADLLIPNETCLVFDRETHEGLTDEDVKECTREVAEHLELLRSPFENKRIGMAGRERLKEVMWSESQREDVESLRAFMERHFGE